MLKKYSKILLFGCLFLFLIAPLNSATELTVFGPQDFEIGGLHLHLSRHSFSVANPGDGHITIAKNTPEQSINAGFLFFNRKFIPLGSFFQSDDIITYKNVSLKGNNYITVFLGGSPNASISVEIDNVDSPIPPPEINFTANPLSIIPGDVSTLSWDVAHADLIFFDNEIGYVAPQGSLEVQPLETTTYTLGAIGPGGNSTETITVTVTLMPPIVEIFAAPETIIFGESTTITWNSTGADTCVIEPDIKEVDPSGNLTAEPNETTTYTIVATGPGGTATDEVTVTVLNPEPIVEFVAEPETLVLGESTTLTWFTEYADTCVIEPDIGAVDLNGSMMVTPTQTTTYTITATGPGGSAASHVTITVYQPPTATVSVYPDSILVRESATLSWSTTYANNIQIDQGIGVVSANGSVVVSPTDTMTYTISASGSGGSVTAQTTVTVVEIPQVGLVVSDNEIDYAIL